MPETPTSPASPGTMHTTGALSDAEIRLAKIEASNARLEEEAAEARRLLADRIAQQAKDDADKGIIPRFIDRVLGKSWSTGLYGWVGAACSAVALFPNDGHPIVFGLTLHQIAGAAAALSMGFLGQSAKSKNVTGLEKPG